MSEIFVVRGPDGYWATVAGDGQICFGTTEGYRGFEYAAALAHPPVIAPPEDALPAPIEWQDFNVARRRVGRLFGGASEFGRRLYALIAEVAGGDQGRQVFPERLEALLRSRIQEPGETRCQICNGNSMCPGGMYQQVRAATDEDLLLSEEDTVPGYRCTHLCRGRYWHMRLVDDRGWRLHTLGSVQRWRVYAHYGVKGLWCGQCCYAIYAVPSSQ